MCQNIYFFKFRVLSKMPVKLDFFRFPQIHKKMGNTHLTLMNFSWATDLDPRGANNQIKGAIDKQYTNEDEEAHGNNEQSKFML